jgi:predicted DNA-binding transcriptional regulator YafY
LSLLAEHVGGREQVPYMRAAARAIKKIRGQLPAKIRGELEQVQDHVAIKLSAATPPESSADVYDAMRSALSSKRALRCKYESLAGNSKDGKPFVFKPYTLLFNQRAWYAVGHHGRYDDIRCLKLNRFVGVEQTDHAYAVPRNFSLDHHLGNAWRIIRGKKSFAIEIYFDPEFAETIAETHWHPSQEVIWNDDGSITFTCKVDGLEEIVWWVLSMGPHCTVKRPRELIAQVRELAAGIVANYAGG